MIKNYSLSFDVTTAAKLQPSHQEIESNDKLSWSGDHKQALLVWQRDMTCHKRGTPWWRRDKGCSCFPLEN